MKRLFLVFIITNVVLKGIAHAGDVEEKLENIRSTCFQHDWSQKVCTKQSPKTLFWDYSNETVLINEELSLFSKVLSYFWNPTRTINTYNFLAYMEDMIVGFNTTGFQTTRSNNEKIYSSFVKELQNFIEGQNLSECQRACLVNCITSKSILLVDDPSQIDDLNPQAKLVFDPASIFAHEKGICMQFAYLSKGLLQEVGLHGEVVFSKPTHCSGHAYAKVQIGQEWYYIEPQLDTCNFMAVAE